MGEHFNELAPAEAERLALLMEEMAEAQHIIGKILRHGYESFNPDTGGPANRGLLEKEMGHVQMALQLMIGAMDLNEEQITWFCNTKYERAKPYLHHQPFSKASNQEEGE